MPPLRRGDGSAAIEAVLGHKEEALRCARKAVELLPEPVDHWGGPRVFWSLAFLYAWTDDKDRAISEFARLLRTGGRHVGNIYEIKADPYYAPLHGVPRFIALINDPKNNAPLF